MGSKHYWAAVSVMLISMLACNLSSASTGQSKPKTVITSPASNTEFRAGDTVTVASVSTDAQGVSAVQLLADGVAVHTDSAPSPQKELSLSQVWVAIAGKHVISVRAYNANGVAGDAANIDLTVPEVSAAAATDTPSGPGYVSVTSQPSDTPTNTPKPPANTPKPVGAPPEDFSGHWYTNYGTLDIVQNGADVSGTLYDAFAVQTGAFTGTVSGGHLSASLAGSPDPGIELDLGANKITFDGQRTGGGTRSGKLCGAKPGHHFPDGCSFSGPWMIFRDPDPHTSDCDLLTLVRIDESVSGRYCNTRTISGTISYEAGGDTLLEGTLMQPGGSGSNPFKLYLMDLGGTQFQGNWQGGSYAFCGWRTGLSQPTYCLRQ